MPSGSGQQQDEAMVKSAFGEALKTWESIVCVHIHMALCARAKGTLWCIRIWQWCILSALPADVIAY